VVETRRTTASSTSTYPIKIDFTAIPDYVREELAEATLESVRAFIRQPGGREFLDARKAAKKAAK
jgi:hypothetical protein